MTVFSLFLNNPGSSGGHLKVLDYAVHAAELGFEVNVVFKDENPNQNSIFFRKPYFRRSRASINFCTANTFRPSTQETILFSLPSDWKWIEKLFAGALESQRVIHLIQNTRHSNHYFQEGFARALLAKNFFRICITNQVRDSILPYVENDRTETVIHGFDTRHFEPNAFSLEKKGLRVCVNEFKSDIGSQVFTALRKSHPKLRLVKIKKGASWGKIKQQLSKSDVFLGSPDPQEGLYLPGLEAMSSGCLLIQPDAGGTALYSRHKVTSIEPELNDVDSYVKAFEWALLNPIESAAIVESGVSLAQTLSLESEMEGLHRVLNTWQKKHGGKK